MKFINGKGDYDFEIVGESHYQRALERIAGPHTEEGQRVETKAVLYLQPDNPHDRFAVRVEINGTPVGHVPRQLALKLRQELRQHGVNDGQRAGVDAVIVGGRLGESYGVWLDIDIEGAVDEVVEYYTEQALPYASNEMPSTPQEEYRRPEYVPAPEKKSSSFVPWWVYVLLIIAILLALRGC